jgi:hypothetical protein
MKFLFPIGECTFDKHISLLDCDISAPNSVQDYQKITVIFPVNFIPLSTLREVRLVVLAAGARTLNSCVRADTGASNGIGTPCGACVRSRSWVQYEKGSKPK